MQISENVSVEPPAVNPSESSFLNRCGHVGKYVFEVVENALCRARDALYGIVDKLLFRKSRDSQNTPLIQAQQTNNAHTTGEGEDYFFGKLSNKDSSRSAKEAFQCEPAHSNTQLLNKNQEKEVKNEDSIKENPSDIWDWNPEYAKAKTDLAFHSDKASRYKPGCLAAEHFKNKKEEAEARLFNIINNGGYSY